MFALICEGRVIQIAPVVLPMHDGLTWVEIPPGQTVKIGDTATETDGVWTFTTPPTPSVAEMLAERMGLAMQAGSSR